MFSSIFFSAEVGLLSRNIVVRGSNDPAWHDDVPACEEGFDTGEFATQTCFQVIYCMIWKCFNIICYSQVCIFQLMLMRWKFFTLSFYLLYSVMFFFISLTKIVLPFCMFSYFYLLSLFLIFRKVEVKQF